MAGGHHLALYCVSEALATYLSAECGKRGSGQAGSVKNVWEIVGVSPSEGMGLADQMLTNGNYFVCYASAGTYALLAEDAAIVDGGWPELDQRRSAYAERIGNAKRSFSYVQHAEWLRKRDEARRRREEATQRGEKVPPETRDQAGRIKYARYDQGWIRKTFYKKWIFPSLSRDAAECLEEVAAEGLAARPASPEAVLGEVAARILREARFYEDLRQNRIPLVEEAFGEDSDERRLLDCFQRLLPIWVYTQCLHANSDVEGLLLNLYNHDFWRCGDAVKGLARRLAEVFGLSAPLSERNLVKEFVDRVDELATHCDEDAEEILRAFERGCQSESATVPELFDDSLRGRWSAPPWAQRRADLIWLFIVSSCVGLERALGGVDRFTADCLDQAELRLGARELGAGSGDLPLHISEGGCDFPSVNLRLSADNQADGVICLLGHAYDSGFWEVVWARSAYELMRNFFTPEAHLGTREQIAAGNPRGLLARLWEKASMVDPRSEERVGGLEWLLRLEEVARGELDVTEALREALAQELFASLERSFAGYGGAGPELVLGVRGNRAPDTLLGALDSAIDRVCALVAEAWERQMEKDLASARERIGAMDVSEEERRSLLRQAEAQCRRRPPSVKTVLRDRLCPVAIGYFRDQLILGGGVGRAGGPPSLLDELLRWLEEVYAEKCGHDPSMRFALARVRRALKGELGKVIRLRDIEDAFTKVFSSFAEAERTAFVPLSSPDVSGRHAILYLEGGRLNVADAGSLNGTVVMRVSTGSDGASGEPRRFVLRGALRTRAERVVRATDPLGGAPEMLDYLPLYRGDAIRLAGRTVIGVGNRS